MYTRPVPFDPQLVEARLALGQIGPDELPALAWDALEAGLDGSSIRKVAALINPSRWETDRLTQSFMTETGLKSITSQEAAMRLARHLARRILSEGLDPLDYSRQFELFWIQADYAEKLQDVGSLDDEKGAFECMGRTESELREHARGVLAALVTSI